MACCRPAARASSFSILWKRETTQLKADRKTGRRWGSSCALSPHPEHSLEVPPEAPPRCPPPHPWLLKACCVLLPSIWALPLPPPLPHSLLSSNTTPPFCPFLTSPWEETQPSGQSRELDGAAMGMAHLAHPPQCPGPKPLPPAALQVHVSSGSCLAMSPPAPRPQPLAPSRDGLMALLCLSRLPEEPRRLGAAHCQLLSKECRRP